MAKGIYSCVQVASVTVIFRWHDAIRTMVAHDVKLAGDAAGYECIGLPLTVRDTMLDIPSVDVGRGGRSVAVHLNHDTNLDFFQN
jgi:hypothetical protein